MNAKNNCPHCTGPVEFDVAQAGQQIPCPHCQAEFLLTLPAVKPVTLEQLRQIKAAQPLPPHEQGVVQMLEIIGVIYLVLGILAAFGALARAFNGRPEGDEFIFWLATAIALAFQSFLIKYLLDGFADLIRQARLIAAKP